MKIIVLGWYGHHNIGDEAYKLAFPPLFPNHAVVFTEKIQENDKADLIILGGGDVVSNFFTDQIKNKKCPKITLSVSLNEGSDLDGLHIFDHVYVRDLKSKEIALGVLPKDKVSYVPDLTFSMKPDIDNGEKLIEKYKGLLDLKLSKTALININSYIGHFKQSSTIKDFAAFIRMSQDIASTIELFDETNFLFIPFGTKSPDDDRVTNGIVNLSCQKYYKNYVIYDQLSVRDTLDLVAASDMVISSRLHATVFSTIALKPFIDITHHTKNLGFLETIGKVDWSVPFWNFDKNKFKSLIESHLFNPQIEDLRSFTEAARDRIHATCLHLSR